MIKSIIISTLVLLYNITACRSFSSPRQTPSHPISSSIISSSSVTPIHQLHSSSKPSTIQLQSYHASIISPKCASRNISKPSTIQLQSYHGSKYTLRNSILLHMSSSDNESVSSSPEDTSTTSSIDIILSKLTSLFPIFVLASAILGSYIPKTLNWVNNGSYITIMLSA